MKKKEKIDKISNDTSQISVVPKGTNAMNLDKKGSASIKNCNPMPMLRASKVNVRWRTYIEVSTPQKRIKEGRKNSGGVGRRVREEVR